MSFVCSSACIVFHRNVVITEKSLKFLRHVWVADWSPCEEEGKKHLSVLKLDHYGYVFGIKFPPLNFHVVATQVAQ